jgi:chromate transport protein ChrA
MDHLAPIQQRCNDGMEWIKQKFNEGVGPIWEKIKGASDATIEAVKTIPDKLSDTATAIGSKLNEAGISTELISYILVTLAVSILVIIAVVIFRRQRAKSNMEKIVEALHAESPSRLCGLSCMAAIVILALMDVFVVQPHRWSKRTKKGVRAAIISAMLICAIVAEDKLFPSAKGHKEPSAMLLTYLAVAVAAIASAQLSVRMVLNLLSRKEAGADAEVEDEAPKDPKED